MCPATKNHPYFAEESEPEIHSDTDISPTDLEENDPNVFLCFSDSESDLTLEQNINNENENCKASNQQNTCSNNDPAESTSKVLVAETPASKLLPYFEDYSQTDLSAQRSQNQSASTSKKRKRAVCPSAQELTDQSYFSAAVYLSNPPTSEQMSFFSHELIFNLKNISTIVRSDVARKYERQSASTSQINNQQGSLLSSQIIKNEELSSVDEKLNIEELRKEFNISSDDVVKNAPVSDTQLDEKETPQTSIRNLAFFKSLKPETIDLLKTQLGTIEKQYFQQNRNSKSKKL